jgi:hypothetical protein
MRAAVLQLHEKPVHYSFVSLCGYQREWQAAHVRDGPEGIHSIDGRTQFSHFPAHFQEVYECHGLAENQCRRRAT